MLPPQCVAVDAKDNIYVTDSDAGKIFVFDANGKFQRAIGSMKGGEGYFKRPTGIAVDSAAQRIYVTDTLRNKIFMLDMQGSVLAEYRQDRRRRRGVQLSHRAAPEGQDLIVVDAMNFRVQVLDRSGAFQYAIGQLGDATGICSVPRESLGFRRPSLRRRRLRSWCRCSIARASCCTTSGNGTGFGNFNCPPAYLSTMTTAFSWWIPTTAASRYFITTESSRPEGGLQ